jgi:O-antigen/teichoic acid export membrane protein
MTRTFGKKKLIKDISSNTLQTGITQVFGLVIFYYTSRYLSKDDFGDFNWSMAVGSTIIAVASLGLDLIYVKRIARQENVLVISGIHFFHTVISGIVLCALTFCLLAAAPSFSGRHPLFFLVLVNLALSNIANSFKLGLNGLEAYRRLAILALCSNAFKFALILVLHFQAKFTMQNIVMAYIATSLLEFCIAYFMLSGSLATRVRPLVEIQEYRYFILESLPQLGVVLFDSALARVDWILLGILSTTAITAEYSFAYRIFELSKLPLLIISPVLLTRFSKIFKTDQQITVTRKKEISQFFRLELFLVMMIPVFLSVCWSPVMNLLTENKYGDANEVEYWILAACIPLHAMINFLWTLGFVQGQLKPIMYITIATSLLNLGLNAVMIPLFDGPGAAWAFLACAIVQLVLYLVLISQRQLSFDLKGSFFYMTIAFIAVFTFRFFFSAGIVSATLATVFYISMALLFRMIKIAETRTLIRGKLADTNDLS